jgi:uroporphyrinogen III methyltransferase/synthase
MSPGGLRGRTVVVTRAAEQAGSLVALLEAAGAHVLLAPTISIEEPPSWAPLDAALEELSSFTWAIFTSVNGVAMVDRRLAARGRSWTDLAGLRVAAIGPATAAALRRQGIAPDLVPDEYRAEGLVEGLRGRIGPADHVLLPRAARTRDVLVRELSRLGARVREVPAYVTRGVETGGGDLRAALDRGAVDAVTLTSSSTARHFARLLGPDACRRGLAGVAIACIGPVTAATAAEHGLVATVMPREYTIPALVGALVEHFSQEE